MKKTEQITIMGMALLSCLLCTSQTTNEPGSAQPVYQVMKSLGAPALGHELEYTEKQVAIGEALVRRGEVLVDGKRSKAISKYFVCTNCHNLEQEDPDIRVSDPDTRLPYTIRKGIPFLQGSTFWGITNRESWYNDDYYLKYGDNVKAANGDLREAIQLCAIECAQGRPLDQWEEDAILAYFWSLQLRLSDLSLPPGLSSSIHAALQAGKKDTALASSLKAYYLTASPATFTRPLTDKKLGYPEKGDAATGQMVYENSCRHCHQEGGVSDFLLDYSPQTFQFLKKHLFHDNDFSIYKIIRKGTYSSPGAIPYMPHYPIEKMSNRQIEGLREYILAQAERP